MKIKKQPIQKLLNRYKNEWLLIDIDEIDKRTLVPKTGRLLIHSPRKEDLAEMFRNGKGHLCRIFSGPPIPPGMRAVFE